VWIVFALVGSFGFSFATLSLASSAIKPAAFVAILPEVVVRS